MLQDCGPPSPLLQILPLPSRSAQLTPAAQGLCVAHHAGRRFRLIQYRVRPLGDGGDVAGTDLWAKECGGAGAGLEHACARTAHLQGEETHRAGGRCSQIQLGAIMQPARTQAATRCTLLSVPGTGYQLPASTT